jgi:lysophospholipid acyltransferase (LPLAT)-like uncharacterized protein
MIPETPSSDPTPVPAASGGSQRSGTVVVPRPLKWHQKLAAPIIYGFIEALARTLRYRYEFPPGFLERLPRPSIFVTWHNRLFLSLILYRHLVRLKHRPHRMAAIVSASRDGGVLARILQHFGVQPVRGSTSRRGPQALLELTTWAERGYDLAITPDGPRGPRYAAQSGAIALAHLTGLPLVPASYHLAWKIQARSWDRFQIPLPFSRVTVRFGEPIPVPREASVSELERLRQLLEDRLRSLTVD